MPALHMDRPRTCIFVLCTSVSVAWRRISISSFSALSLFAAVVCCSREAKSRSRSFPALR